MTTPLNKVITTPNSNNGLLKVVPDVALETRNANAQEILFCFNPPDNKNVNNVAGDFLMLTGKHFPKTSHLHRLYYRNTIKVSYIAV